MAAFGNEFAPLVGIVPWFKLAALPRPVLPSYDGIEDKPTQDEDDNIKMASEVASSTEQLMQT